MNRHCLVSLTSRLRPCLQSPHLWSTYYMHRRRLPTPTSPTFNWSPSMSPRLPRAVPSVSASSVYPAFTTPLSDHQCALDLAHSSSDFRLGSPNITTAARLVSPDITASACVISPGITTPARLISPSAISSARPSTTTVTSSASLSISSTPLRVHSSHQFVNHSPPVSSPSSSSSSPVSSSTSNVSPTSPLAGGPSSHPRHRVHHNPRRMYRIQQSYPILNTAPVIAPASIPPTFAEVCRVIAIFFLILAHHGSPHQ